MYDSHQLKGGDVDTMREQTKEAVTGSNKDAQPDDQRLFEREDALHGCTHERRSESPTKVATGSSRKIERNNVSG
jgi:hypothetical protein